MLPQGFKELERFEGWALAAEGERNRKRLSSSIEEIREFCGAVLPKLESIVHYLNQFYPGQMLGEASALLFLVMSLAEVAPAIEWYRQASVIGGFDPSRFIIDDGFVLKPVP